jgi:hypothetical protein
VNSYVRTRTVVSTRYTTVNVVKTIEEVLGIGPIGLNDALAAPMTDVFDTSQAAWSYKAVVPAILRSTKLPLPLPPIVVRHAAAFQRLSSALSSRSGPPAGRIYEIQSCKSNLGLLRFAFNVFDGCADVRVGQGWLARTWLHRTLAFNNTCDHGLVALHD